MSKWADIPGYRGHYQASDAGDVRSVERRCRTRGGSTRLVPAKVLSVAVCLTIDGRSKTRTVHQLVLEAFVGLRPENTETCHGNGDRSDNRLQNLRWDTRKANSADRIAHGTAFAGQSHPLASLTDAQALGARERAAKGEHARDIAADLGMSYSGMRKVISGRTYGHLPVIDTGRHGNSALTAQRVAEIRRRVAAGEQRCDLARDLGVSASTVTRIMRRIP